MIYQLYPILILKQNIYKFYVNLPNYEDTLFRLGQHPNFQVNHVVLQIQFHIETVYFLISPNLAWQINLKLIKC